MLLIIYQNKIINTKASERVSFLLVMFMKVYVVHGSPLSGKSTYVQQHKGPNDLIYDFDLIMQAISGLPLHNQNNNLIPYVLDVRDLLISRLKGETNIDNAWIIVTRVTEQLKQSLIGLNAEYIEMKIDIHTAKRRLHDDPDGRDIQEWEQAIDRHFMVEQDWSWFYKTSEWKRKRIAILKRDDYKCKECSRYGKVVEANTIHHIIPLQESPELKLDNRNLISLCEQCHERMHNKFDNTLSKLGEEWKERLLAKHPELTSPLV